MTTGRKRGDKSAKAQRQQKQGRENEHTRRSGPAAEMEVGDLETEQWLNESLRRFDAMFEPPAPSLQALQELADNGRKAANRKLWRDLVLFWIVGCIVTGGVMLLLKSDIVWFAALQAAAAVAGVAFAAVTGKRRTAERTGSKWAN